MKKVSFLKKGTRSILTSPFTDSFHSQQTCIAPDYVLVSKKNQDKLVEEFKKAASEFWPDKDGGIVKSNSYGKIVNDNHWKRLNDMLGGTKGEIVLGEAGDPATKFMPPTVVKNVTADDSTMRGEICEYREVVG